MKRFYNLIAVLKLEFGYVIMEVKNKIKTNV